MSPLPENQAGVAGDGGERLGVHPPRAPASSRRRRPGPGASPGLMGDGGPQVHQPPRRSGALFATVLRDRRARRSAARHRTR